MSGRKISVYCRVSTDKIEQQNSLLNQSQLFQPKIEADGDELYKIFFDEGLTGTKLNNRKGFNEMLTLAGLDIIETLNKKLLPNGNFDSRVKRKTTQYLVSDREPIFEKIYIKNTSRFARNTLSYDLIVKLRQKGVSIYFLEQNIDTADCSNDFLLQLFQVFDQNDSRDKSFKVITGIKKSAERGVVRTNKRIFGYHYSEDNNSLTAIPVEAETIKRIFSLYLDGFGIRQIISKLSLDGQYTRDGKPFCKTAINRILRNEKYYGGTPVLKYDTGRVFEKESYAKVKSSYDVLISDRIEPIIDYEIFEAVQEKMASKVENGKASYVGTSKFACKITCGCCGSRYISDKDKRADGFYEFYRCQGKKEKGIDFCSSPSISKEKFEQKLSQDIQNQRLEKMYKLSLQALSQQLEHLQIIFSSDTLEEQKELKSKISVLETEIVTSFREFSSGRLPEALYASIVEEDNKALETAKFRLETLLEPERTYNERKSILLTRVDFIHKKMLVGFTEQDYLNNLQIVVSQKGKLYYTYKVSEFDDEIDNLMHIVKEKHKL